jgi:hypothetical protein
MDIGTALGQDESQQSDKRRQEAKGRACGSWARIVVRQLQVLAVSPGRKGGERGRERGGREGAGRKEYDYSLPIVCTVVEMDRA